jgi:pimeloyl-ACP methyl ester carboxylesterase
MKDAKKLPCLLKLYTRGDDDKLLKQFEYVPDHISFETLQNATDEALRLYGQIDDFEPDPEAKVSIWYGEKEPNMKTAIKKLKKAFPNAQLHPFAGYGHGQIMSDPERMAEDIKSFMEE